MTVPPPNNRFAHIVRDIDPSRPQAGQTGDDASPGVITEAEKPQARARIDERIAVMTPNERLGGDGVRRHLGQLRDLRARLDAPGDFDARTAVYRRAQEVGLPVTRVDSRRMPDYDLSPDELASAVDSGIQHAASIDRQIREARGRTPPDEARIATLTPQLDAARVGVTQLRQHRVLALVEGLNLPTGTPVDVNSQAGLVDLRERLDAEIGRWRGMDDPRVVEMLANNPGDVLARQRLLAAARSEVSMTMGGADAMAQALFNATLRSPSRRSISAARKPAPRLSCIA